MTLSDSSDDEIAVIGVVPGAGGEDGDEEGEDDEEDDERHHPGHLEVDYDLWDDWDERVHGKIDTNARRREFPENFVWSCCGEPGDSEGCAKGEGQTVDELYATSPEPSVDEGDSDEERHHDGCL